MALGEKMATLVEKWMVLLSISSSIPVEIWAQNHEMLSLTFRQMKNTRMNLENVPTPEDGRKYHIKTVEMKFTEDEMEAVYHCLSLCSDRQTQAEIKLQCRSVNINRLRSKM